MAKPNGSKFYQSGVGWRRLCVAANVLGRDGKHKRPHDNRRSSVRRLEWEGIPREVAKELVGHKTDSMYNRYMITNDADKRAAVRRLGQTQAAQNGHSLATP